MLVLRVPQDAKPKRDVMKVLSVRQPWVWLMIRPDLHGEERKAASMDGRMKIIENRSWPTAYRGPVLIHAAKAMTALEYMSAERYLEDFPREKGIAPVVLPPMNQLQRGGIVGMARLVDCIAPASRTGGEQSHWHVKGMYGWRLADACALPFEALKGRLGLFEPPLHFLEAGLEKLVCQSERPT